jgi:CRP/FNR family transcriptional regulator, cyclic AMP receptor protein
MIMASLSNVFTCGTDQLTSEGRRHNYSTMRRRMRDRTAGHETEGLAAIAYEELPAPVVRRRPVDRIALLRTHPAFGALAPEQIKRLGSLACARRVASSTTLFVKGDPGTALFAVVSGTVKIAVPSIDGREATFNLLYAGDIFGEIALLDGRPRTADAIAITDCELILIKRRDFLSFVHDEPKVALKLIELLCARLRVAGTREEELVFLNLPARLARLLLRLVDENAAAADKNKLSITQQEISGMLGTTRESVNKHLQIWARRRVIALKRGTILVLEPRALAVLVSGGDDGNGDDFWRPGAKRK